LFFVEVYISALKTSIKAQAEAEINQGQSIKINQPDSNKGGNKKGCC